MKTLASVILLLLITSCNPIRVYYDYEKNTNFNQYKTYNYYAEMTTGLSDLDTRRLLDALDRKLVEKGFLLAETPDFFIDIKSSEIQGVQSNNVGVGVGGGGGMTGGGVSFGLPIGQPQVNRQITIDFVDENKKQLFWQAVSESVFRPNQTPEKREALLNDVVEKVFLKYPPKR